MKRIIAFVLAVLCITAVMTGCASKTQSGISPKSLTIFNPVYPVMAQYPENDSSDYSEKYDKWIKENAERKDLTDDFADELDTVFAELMKEFSLGADGENRIISPLNIYMALSLLAEITDGNSRAQILAVLGSSDIEEVRTRASAIWKAGYCDDGVVKSILANSIWLDDKIEYNSETLKTLAEQYYASSHSGVMGSDEYNGELQNWLNEQTGGLLNEQVKGVTFDPSVIVSLASTVYFKASWEKAFSAAQTIDHDFHAPDGDENGKFLRKSERIDYYDGEGYSAVRLVLGNGSMWVMLPDEGVSLDAMVSDSDIYKLLTKSENKNQANTRTVNLVLPKFDVVSDMDLCGGLKNLGITDVFDSSSSDFTKLCENLSDVYVSEAMHAARVKIDEKGCEAAAYTVLMMEATAAISPSEEIDFVVDRPFMFVITGIDGLPMFSGAVCHPFA